MGLMPLVRCQDTSADLSGNGIKGFPLFCPKCRHESIINVKNFIIQTKQLDAKTQC